MSKQETENIILSQAEMQLFLQGIKITPCRDFLFAVVEQCQENQLSVTQATEMIVADTKACYGY